MLKPPRLGDILILPNGQQVTVRSVAKFRTQVQQMAGFVLGGELEVLISIPDSRVPSSYDIYVPVPRIPAALAQARTVLAGVASYWPPHLPGMVSALAELQFRVVMIRGDFTPYVIVYRGSEVVPFVKSATGPADAFLVTEMRRGVDVSGDVPYRSGFVAPVMVPSHVPAPVHAPAKVPVKVPVRSR